MTNKTKTTHYIGVTADLQIRIYQPRHHPYASSFADRYNLEYCIYYESFSTIEEAIDREKQLKKWRREKKEQLIKTTNPYREDLWEREIKHW